MYTIVITSLFDVLMISKTAEVKRIKDIQVDKKSVAQLFDWLIFHHFLELIFRLTFSTLRQGQLQEWTEHSQNANLKIWNQ